MSADPNTPLFILSNNDDIKYEDNPAITQAKANLAAAECIQQEKAEQRRLEREEWKVRAEAEKKQRELEVEMERLMQEKERLEEEKQVEQWHAAMLCGSERAAEQR